jgi:hypothetical protein
MAGRRRASWQLQRGALARRTPATVRLERQPMISPLLDPAPCRASPLKEMSDFPNRQIQSLSGRQVGSWQNRAEPRDWGGQPPFSSRPGKGKVTLNTERSVAGLSSGTRRPSGMLARVTAADGLQAGMSPGTPSSGMTLMSGIWLWGPLSTPARCGTFDQKKVSRKISVPSP